MDMKAWRQVRTRAERIAVNEDFARTLNERHAELAGGFPVMAGFRCECWQESCSERIPLSRADWEAVRAKANRFAVAPGHVAARYEVVVAEHPGFWTIDKTGEAAEVAEELAEQRGGVARPDATSSP
jgi:hypothetical protein